MGRIIRQISFLLLLWAITPAVAAPLESLFILKQGELHQDEIWTGKILLVSDVIVPEGRTLSIAPGTWLVFNEADFDNHGKHTERSELIVDGTLIAQADSIALYSLGDAPVQEYIRQHGEPEAITIAPQPVEPSDLTNDWRKYKHNYALLWVVVYSLWLIL